MADVPDVASGFSAARPALIRAMNERSLLERIRFSGPCSRAELARLSGLSKPTVSLALANLERAGLVRLAGQRTGMPGRSALLYEVRPEAGFVLALDIGLRYLRGAVADLAGEVRARGVREVAALSARAAPAAGNGAAGPRERVTELVRLADDLCGQAGIARSEVTQTVVGSPGVHDRERGVIALTGGLPRWGEPEALKELRSAFGSALTIENDVDAAALAERAHGHGRDVDDFAFVHIGTGIGMGLVIGGRLHRGRHGAAGEIAFLPLGGDAESGRGSGAGEDLNPDPAEERRRGSLETAAAAAGIVRSAWRAGMKDAVSAQEVFAAGAEGDPRARAVIAAEARLVANAICCVIAVADPSLVVLGGGIGRAHGFVTSVTEELARIAPVMPDVRVSALGTDAVVDGCLAEGTSLAWDDLAAALP